MNTPLEDAAAVVLILVGGYAALRMLGRLLDWRNETSEDNHHD